MLLNYINFLDPVTLTFLTSPVVFWTQYVLQLQNFHQGNLGRFFWQTFQAESEWFWAASPTATVQVKGQLISKCPFGIIVWTKFQRNYFWISALNFFYNFLGASCKLFGASCRLPCLWNYILSPQEAQKASRKPPGSYKKNSGQKSRNNFVGILSKQ